MACEHSIDAGAYALDALDGAEAAAFREHLRDCAACRVEVGRLQVVVDTLPIAVEQISPPAGLRDRIMRDVHSEAALLGGARSDAAAAPERRRWWRPAKLRPAIAIGLACALLAVGIGAGIALNDGSNSSRVIAAAAPRGASATLHITGTRAALELRHMPSPPPGDVYQVWFVKQGDKPIPTHTLFNVRSDGRATVQIEEPVDGVRQIMVTAEPSGHQRSPDVARETGLA
jgi:anti-sigma factor RsiW